MSSAGASTLAASANLHNLLISPGTTQTLPTAASLAHSTSKIQSTIPTTGLGPDAVANHLLHDLTPGLNGSSLSPTYYGFVTGGSTPIARLADNIVTAWDQNVSVHLPRESIATIVEDRALAMLLQLFALPDTFATRTLTTGATASNVLGLASGRDYVLAWHSRNAGRTYVPENGLLRSCLDAGIAKIQILTTCPHSSLGKAASIVGLGSGCMVDVSTRQGGGGLRFDMQKLETYLREKGAANIVAVSCAEVNLGGFATGSLSTMQELRRLCDEYGAWLHVDAAFGLFAALLPDIPSYTTLRAGTQGMYLADSITSDAHKLLNVPYDTGIFFSRHASVSANVTANPNAPYLRGTPGETIVSPLNLGLENSRRWRALPVYANLLAYGRDGWADMVQRMVLLARGVAAFVLAECPGLEVVFPEGVEGGQHEHEGEHEEESKINIETKMQRIFIVVAFRARNEARNASLVQRIKDDRRIYVSGTVVEGRPAARIAVAKWDVDVERDLEAVKGVLRDVQ